MKRVNRKQLQPGMQVAKTVYNPSGQVLIAAGMCLSIPWIERLGEQGIDYVEVEDGLAASIKVIPNTLRQKEALKTRNSFKRNAGRAGSRRADKYTTAARHHGSVAGGSLA